MSAAMEWEGDAKLDRQRSCAYPPAPASAFGGWRSKSGRLWSLGLSRRHVGVPFEGEDDDFELEASSVTRAGRPRWHGFWRRIVKGKRKIFGGAPPAVPYDPFTYAQNFEDLGAAPWEEPENLSRSFSARFANPSALLRRFE